MLTSAAVTSRTYDTGVENGEVVESMSQSARRGNSLLTDREKWRKMSANCAAPFILVHILQTAQNTANFPICFHRVMHYAVDGSTR